MATCASLRLINSLWLGYCCRLALAGRCACRGLAYGIPQWNYSMEKVEYPWNVECLETAELKLSKYSEYPYVLEARFEYSRKSKVRSHQSV